VICRPGKPRAAGEAPDGAALIRSAIVSPGIDAVERHSEQNPAMAGFLYAVLSPRQTVRRLGDA